MKLTSYILLIIKRFSKTVLPSEVYEKLRTFYFSHGRKVKEIYPVPTDLPFGVNLFIYEANNSAGVEGNLLKLALEAAEIPYRIIDLNAPEKFHFEGINKPLYRINLIVLHAASDTIKRMPLFEIDFRKYYNIGYWAWELAEVPDAFCGGLDIFQEIWTMSTFCTRALEKKATIPVITVPLFANPERGIIENGRDYFKMNKDTFLFMFAYDCNSFVSRKNPQAVVKAFMEAFSPEDCHVGLVLKLAYTDHFKKHIEDLMTLLAPYKNIYYIDRFLNDNEMRTLIQISDAFVSLHRAEGFGLLPIEAMSLGTPVISTEWSGNMEYMNHMNSALVGYHMVPVNGEYVGSSSGDGLMWAEPDVSEAATYMRRMVADKDWRERLITNGKYTADECYNAKNIGCIMRDRLTFLGLNQLQ